MLDDRARALVPRRALARRPAGWARPVPPRRGRPRRAAATAAAPASMRSRLLLVVLHHLQSPFQLVGMVERAGGDQAGPARGFDQGAGIIVARVGRGGGGDGGVAGQLLIGAEGAEGDPGDRIEPVEREHDEPDMVPPDVAAAMVDGLMVERERALRGGIAASRNRRARRSAGRAGRARPAPAPPRFRSAAGRDARRCCASRGSAR